MKIGGIVLIIFSCTLLGWQQANHYRRRIGQLCQLQTAFRILETEITYSLTPLPLAMKKVSCQLSSWLNNFFQQIAVKMTQEKMSWQEAWQVTENLLEQSDLLMEDIIVLQETCSSLGQGDLGAQQKAFALLQQRLQYNLEEAQAECKQKEPLWRYLGISGGVALVLILI